MSPVAMAVAVPVCKRVSVHAVANTVAADQMLPVAVAVAVPVCKHVSVHAVANMVAAEIGAQMCSQQEEREEPSLSRMPHIVDL